MYQFQVLNDVIDSANLVKLDTMHQQLSLSVQRQSERNFPRGSVRNGILDSIKCQFTERRGNLFCLLCITATILGAKALAPALQQFGITMSEMEQF